MAGCFGGEEGLEDARQDGGRDAGAVVPYFDESHLRAETGGELEDGIGGGGLHRVERVFDESGPDLVELAAVGADGRECGVEVELDPGVFEARVEHDEGVFERLGEIDVLDGRLVHVGVVLDGADEVEDAHGGVDDGLGHALDAEGAGDGGKGYGEDLGAHEGGKLIEHVDGELGLCE